MVGAWALLFQVLAFVSQLAQSHGNTTRFSFPSFGDNGNQLIYMGNASFSPSHGYIDLTPSPNATSTDEYTHLQNRIGRVLFHQPITIWPATFTTTFTMLVRNITSPAGQVNLNGDGVAFIIVPNDKPFPPNSPGQFLGLFEESAYQNPTPLTGLDMGALRAGKSYQCGGFQIGGRF